MKPQEANTGLAHLERRAPFPHVAHPPERPVLIFDGECQFCLFWVRRWQRIAGPTLECIPLQDPIIATQFPELPRERLETSVHLIGPGGWIYFGAEAVLRSLAVNPSKRWPLWIYEHIPGAPFVAEWGYRLVARNRRLFSVLTRLLWGGQ